MYRLERGALVGAFLRVLRDSKKSKKFVIECSLLHIFQ